VRKLGLLLGFLGFALSAWAAKGISVGGLEQRLAADRGKPDAEVAWQLSDLELTERLSPTALARLEAASPGTKTAQELRILADESAFLPLPAAEIPTLAEPDLTAQRQMMALVVNYVAQTIHQLPNFYATRVTTQYEETPLVQSGVHVIPYRPLHETNAFDVTVLYRNGQEVVDTGAGKPAVAKPQGKGLSVFGEFGPIIGTVFLDAARSSLSWSHWEQGATGPRAVFRYAVPLEKSHFRVNYCCVAGSDPGSVETQPFDRIVGYHGDITVDPHEGSILRLTVQADLKPVDPISKADIMVDYGPVEIGGKSYICATRSVALSSAISHSDFKAYSPYVAETPQGPPQKLLNDVAFEDYHMFRADTRMLTGSEAQEEGAPPALSSTSAATTEPALALAAPPATGAGGEGAGEQSLVRGSGTQMRAPGTTLQQKDAGQAAAPMPAPASQPAPAAETTAPSAIDQAPVLRTTTRQVVVDVVATNRDGSPVTGLSKEDFEVKEDGQAQTVNFFAEHTKSKARASAAPEMPTMPVGARTNVPPAPSGDAVNILLIDTLNTEMQDQASVRRQVMDFLGKLQPGTRMAIFLLGSKLVCLQGITADTTALLAALKDEKNGLKSQKSSYFESRSDRAGDQEDLSMLQTEQTSPYAIEALQSALGNAGARNTGARISMTFQALMYLGHYMSGIPGRKNLIWVSGSFPIAIFPTADEMARLKNSSGGAAYLERVKRTADLFTVSQIAVYPINAEGLMMDHVGEANSSGPGMGGGSGHAGSGGDTVIAPYSAGAGERASTMDAMEQLATSTGGNAYYNTNDLDAALASAIDAGANYYEIGYSPENTKMDGSYRRIEVKLRHGKGKLAYRRGYNADDNLAPVAKAPADPLEPLLQAGLPGATGILYGVRAERGAGEATPGDAGSGQNPNLKGPLTPYTVDFIIRSQDLDLKRQAQGDRSGKFLVGLRAYDEPGNPVNWEAEEETVDIRPDQFELIRKNGIKVQLKIDLPSAGELHLVTAVYDLESGMAGTLEIPLRATSTARVNTPDPGANKHP